MTLILNIRCSSGPGCTITTNFVDSCMNTIYFYENGLNFLFVNICPLRNKAISIHSSSPYILENLLSIPPKTVIFTNIVWYAFDQNNLIENFSVRYSCTNGAISPLYEMEGCVLDENDIWNNNRNTLVMCSIIFQCQNISGCNFNYALRIGYSLIPVEDLSGFCGKCEARFSQGNVTYCLSDCSYFSLHFSYGYLYSLTPKIYSENVVAYYYRKPVK